MWTTRQRWSGIIKEAHSLTAGRAELLRHDLMQLDPAGTAQPDRKTWHDCAVPVVIFLVAAVILGGIVVVAMGRGGELAREKV